MCIAKTEDRNFDFVRNRTEDIQHVTNKHQLKCVKKPDVSLPTICVVVRQQIRV